MMKAPAILKRRTESGEVVFYRITALYICLMLTAIVVLLIYLGTV